MNGIQVSRHISSSMGETSSVKPTTTFLGVVPGVQATVHQTKALGDRNQTQAVGDHERSVETKLPEWLQPPTEGLTMRFSSSTDVSPADVEIPPPALPRSAHPPAKPTSNKSGGKHILFTHFPKDPNCGVCRSTKFTRAPCKVNPDDRARTE